MGKRRDAREWVVQILFWLEMNPWKDLDKVFVNFWQGEGSEADEAARGFVEIEVRGVLENQEKLDKMLTEYMENWTLNRVSGTDKSVLRMALYEMHFVDDIPPVVSINEAVDIAKFFSDSKSGRFVNGILDRARKDLDKPSR